MAKKNGTRRLLPADGLGKTVPPPLRFVLIYFEQKERTRSEAMEFLKFYSGNGWTTLTGQKIKNWKAAANGWIWDLMQAQRLQMSSLNKTKATRFLNPTKRN